MTRSQFACILLLSVAGCDEKPSPNGPFTPTGPTETGETVSYGWVMSGTVVEIGGGPVAGARVSARSCDDIPAYNHVFAEVETGGTGEFRITFRAGSQLRSRCVYLRAEKTGYVRPIEEEATWTGGRTDIKRDNITIKLQRLRRATGRVIEVESGAGVPGVEVSGDRSSPPSVLSDVNGFFVLEGIGNFLNLARNNFVTRIVSVPEGQDVDLGAVPLQRTIALRAGARMTTQISSRDVYYDNFFVMWDDGVFCSPCKAIDLETQGQDLEIRLQWSGEIPLGIWAWMGGYDESRARPAPGQSILSFRVPAATRVLLVGAASPAPGQQTVGQPVPFELAAVPVSVSE